jgi:hypothetical protein
MTVQNKDRGFPRACTWSRSYGPDRLTDAMPPHRDPTLRLNRTPSNLGQRYIRREPTRSELPQPRTRGTVKSCTDPPQRLCLRRTAAHTRSTSARTDTCSERQALEPRQRDTCIDVDAVLRSDVPKLPHAFQRETHTVNYWPARLPPVRVRPLWSEQIETPEIIFDR